MEEKTNRWQEKRGKKEKGEGGKAKAPNWVQAHMVTSLSQGNIKGRGDNKDKRGGRGEEKSKKTKRRKFLKRKFPGVERGVGKSFLFSKYTNLLKFSEI